MKGFLFAMVIAAVAMSAAAGKPSKPAAKPKIKVLFMVGGGAHDFQSLPPILKQRLEGTGDFAVTITEDREKLTTLSRDGWHVALFYTQGGDLTPAQEEGLTDFVSSGRGYAGIHCASDSFKSSDAYFKLVGGQFSGHGYGTFTVKITARRHPITKGMADFEIEDETYNHEFYPQAKVQVLARRATDQEPSVWVQNYGKGRVFYTGLGHGKEAFENPSFQMLMIRGISWAAGRPVPPLQPQACAQPKGAN